MKLYYNIGSTYRVYVNQVLEGIDIIGQEKSLKGMAEKIYRNEGLLKQNIYT